MSFAQAEMIVNERTAAGNKEVGRVNIFVPTLKDLIQYVTADIAKDEKGADKYEGGLPVYVNDEANWIQGAIEAQCRMQARNKLVPKTATLKPGMSIADSWEGLTAEGVRDGAGLKLLHAFRAAFAEWVSKQGISEAAANTLVSLATNKNALILQQAGTKEKVKARLVAFADSLGEEDLTKFMRPLEAATNACEATADTLDF